MPFLYKSVEIHTWASAYRVVVLRSQKTLKSLHLKNVFFLLYIVEISFGNGHTKFSCLRTSDNDIILLKIFKYFLYSKHFFRSES